MRTFCLRLILLLLIPLPVVGQAGRRVPYQIYAGFNRLSNSLNGVPGARHPLNGWNAGVAFPAWHSLRFKFDVSGLNGTNNGAPQHPVFVMAGGQYERFLHREGFFVQALLGNGGANRNWGPGGHAAMADSFSTMLGGGLDTPISRHFALRAEGDFQYSNFALVQSNTWQWPYEIAGLPNYFGRFSTGIVWMPRVAESASVGSYGISRSTHSPASDLVFENLNSVGHYSVHASTWWSYLHVAGIEYDRHSWGRFIGARMDYVAEILPLVILIEPAKADVWGNPETSAQRTLPGLGISPIGLRMLWRDDGRWKPYLLVKGGLIAFTHKALSQLASYQDFTLQENMGCQFRLTRRWDLRAGVGDFHFSNAYAEPSNPGIDEMSYAVALAYHLRMRRE